MKPYCLHFDLCIAALEESKLWKTAVELVYSNWTEDKNSIVKLISAGTQLWYTMLVMDEYSVEDWLESIDRSIQHTNFEIVENDWLTEKLMVVTNFGLEHFSDNAYFNAYFGYMIKVMPYFFSDFNGKYDLWQSKGRDMIKEAYAMLPDDPFLSAMYWATFGNTAAKNFWMSAVLYGRIAVLNSGEIAWYRVIFFASSEANLQRVVRTVWGGRML